MIMVTFRLEKDKTKSIEGIVLFSTFIYTNIQQNVLKTVSDTHIMLSW